MSKIFTAIRKIPGEMSDLVLPMLELDQQNGSPDEDHEAMVRAVVGDEDMAPSIPAPQGTRPEDPAPVVMTDRVRRMHLRLPASAPLLPFDGSNVAAAEQYRIIRTKLLQHESRPRMLLVSSAGPADGKTVTAINIAGALALKSDAKVLLADTDFRRSTIHKQLELPSSPGLLDVLSGAATLESALIRAEQFRNLYVISAGEPRTNPSELLDSPRWTSLCNELRSQFAYVIADSPPVASVADYDLLQAACDGVVLVVRPDHTKRQSFLKLLEIIPKEKLIGVVMNCVEDWFLGRSSGYAPYYGYHEPAEPANGTLAANKRRK